MSSVRLHLPDHASPREKSRLAIVTRALGERGVGVVGPGETAHPEANGRAPNGEVPAAEPVATLLSLAERRPDTAELAALPANAVWWVCEGDPRRDGPSDGLGRAIARRRPFVAMTLRRLAERPEDDRILAFADTPRRPWDSLAALEARLDSFLPQLIAEAAAQETRNLALPAPTAGTDSPVAKPQARNLVERLTDLKFYVHLLFGGLRPLFRFRGTYVILFHNPAPDILDDTLTILRKVGRLVPYTEVVQAILDERAPEPGFALTFDDGYKENAALLDILEKHGCAAMFFLNTAPIDSERPLWFMNRDKNYWRHKPQLKTLDYHAFLTAIDDAGLTEPSALRGRFGLTSEEVRTLLARGHAIGLHTHNHPFLTHLNKAEIDQEIAECAQRLEEITGEPAPKTYFAYPDGDHDLRVAEDLEAIGIRSAATTGPGPVPRRVRPTMIPRLPIADTDYPGMALFKLCGVYRQLKRLQSALGHGN